MSSSNKSFSQGTFYVSDGLGAVYQYKGKKRGKTQYKAIFKLTKSFVDHPDVAKLFEYINWDDLIAKCQTWGSMASTNLLKYERNLNEDTALFMRDIKKMRQMCQACGWTDILKKDRTKRIELWQTEARPFAYSTSCSSTCVADDRQRESLLRRLNQDLLVLQASAAVCALL